MKKKIVDVEQVIFEEVVAVDKYRKDINLLVMPNRIVFQMKKGLFRKVYKDIEVNLLSDIKVLDGKVCISRKGDTILLGAFDETYEIVFDDKKRAKEFEVLIINSVSGTKPIGRVFNKVVGLVKNVNDAIDPRTKKMIGTAIITFAGAVISKLIEQNRDK